MADAEGMLRPVLKRIAEEQVYNDYTTEVSFIDSGGANYSSYLYKIALSAPGKDDIKLFAKTAVVGEKVRLEGTTQVYRTENMFYTKLVPQYKKYEEQYKFPTEDRLVLPKFYGGSTDYLKEVLVLEDLTAKCFGPFDRFKYYDWEYASKCVSFLAKFHALSIRYRRDFPEEFEDICQELAVKLPLEDMKLFIDNGVRSGLQGTTDENRERLTKFITKEIVDEKFKAYYDTPRNIVLNHFDFRPNNIVHKTNDDGKIDIVVLDYQTLRKGNPVSDLVYFLITGSDEEFREKYFPQLFDNYYEEFSRILRMLEINPDEVYPRKHFDKDVKEIMPFGIILGLAILPVITVDIQDAPKLEEGIDFESFAIEPNNLFRERFDGLVRFFVKMGIL